MQQRPETIEAFHAHRQARRSFVAESRSNVHQYQHEVRNDPFRGTSFQFHLVTLLEKFILMELD